MTPQWLSPLAGDKNSEFGMNVATLIAILVLTIGTLVYWVLTHGVSGSCGCRVNRKSRRGRYRFDKDREVGVQTTSKVTPAYWEWSAVELKAEAKKHGIDSGQLKAKLITALVRGFNGQPSEGGAVPAARD